MENDFVQIVEVSPRDGLQNIKQEVPTDIKLKLIDALLDAGASIIESTSFVSPKWVPQMSDHQAIAQALQGNTRARFPVLVPNLKGLETAMTCHVKDIAVFASASETFSQKNINKSIEQSMTDFEEVIGQAKEHHLRVRGYLSCVLGCPYEGHISVKKVAELALRMFEAGCEEISLGDTIGVGTPKQAADMLCAVAQSIPMKQLAVHFHDTYGQALANIYACLEKGVRIVDSSVAGLGGCPYARGASGNVATEDVLYLCQGLGLNTNIDLDKMILAGKMICDYLQSPNHSKVALARMGTH